MSNEHPTSEDRIPAPSERLLNRAGYVICFIGSHVAAWHHMPSAALGLAGIAFFFLSRTNR